MARVHDVLTAVGASVTDFTQFSNLSVCITFELLGTRLRELESNLRAAGLSFKASEAGECDAEIAAQLQITFFHSEPDLRIKQPAVPG